MSKSKSVWSSLLIAAMGLAVYSSAAFSQSAKPERSALRYDLDYPLIGYAKAPTENQIARLQTKIDRGEVKLVYSGVRGYLDSLLKELQIDPSSQVLVYSKTSLQIDDIKPATPRAMYFNDDSYVAWVQGSDLLELSVMDAKMGAVFYTLLNQPGEPVRVQRETLRCLNCHDTFSLSGGGVPRFLLSSTLVDSEGIARTTEFISETDDRTPLVDRWGGWYVTGKKDGLQHLGNVLVHSATEVQRLEKVRRGTLDQLAKDFDTTPYLTNKSDIVALLVLEHQLYVKNLITRLNYKARTFVAKELPASDGDGVAFADLPPQTQTLVKAMSEQLLKAMLFRDAAEFPNKVGSTSGFDKWFPTQGAKDQQGRSLRDLDLSNRLFKHRLSYVIYSESFDKLPTYARAYIYGRLADILSGKDQSITFAYLPPTERKDILEILTATKPEFAKMLNVSSGVNVAQLTSH